MLLATDARHDGLTARQQWIDSSFVLFGGQELLEYLLKVGANAAQLQ